MADYPENLKYTKEHEWSRINGKNAVIGITEFAKDQLGDVVYLELPEVGAEVKRGQPFGVVESTKAVSELFALLDHRPAVPDIRRNAEELGHEVLLTREPEPGVWEMHLRRG